QFRARINRFCGRQRQTQLVSQLNYRADDRLDLNWTSTFDVLQHRGFVVSYFLSAGESLLARNAEFDPQSGRDRLYLLHDRARQRASLAVLHNFQERRASQCTDRIEGDVSHQLDPHVVANVCAYRTAKAGFDENVRDFAATLAF